ncbi:hypothetical protein [uncultured Sphingomonas sp.]|uniref:hypothetical protein n=1 Tax=uncultured Sphingomonas sp. TaxID=158754 RepID=UPI0025E4A5BF|nr:hypothetical protein [uncultured Sphingomonas sp.]
MITAEEAMDAALRFAQPPCDDAHAVHADAQPARIGDVAVWSVTIQEAPIGPDAWMEIHWQPVSYFVDAKEGRVIGFATERGTTMLRQDADIARISAFGISGPVITGPDNSRWLPE